MSQVKKLASQAQFACEQCGAIQKFVPGSKTLRCPYCGHVNVVTDAAVPIHEYDFRKALAELGAKQPAQAQSIQCQTCAAQFTFDQNTHSGECPFCGTPIVVGTGLRKPIKPRSLLPFKIRQAEAQTAYRAWLKGLWFAPNRLKLYARNETKLSGVYMPYWTYDSHTISSYRGQRGDTYQVAETYTSIEQGRRVRRTRMVTKVQWTPASGTVSRFFDDVLVGASQSLPRAIMRRLQPWDLENLVAYNEQYLSGFRSEVYQIRLDEGFNQAVKIMDRVIRDDVARAIGGDLQRIDYIDTRHSRTTFKHLLLPVWSAAFRYRGKTYRFVINGRTGKVRGERPYSVWKVALAVLMAVVGTLGLVWILKVTGVLEHILRSL